MNVAALGGMAHAQTACHGGQRTVWMSTRVGVSKEPEGPAAPERPVGVVLLFENFGRSLSATANRRDPLSETQ